MPMYNGEGVVATTKVVKTINFDDELDDDIDGDQPLRGGGGGNSSCRDPAAFRDAQIAHSPMAVDSRRSSPKWGTLAATPMPGSSPLGGSSKLPLTRPRLSPSPIEFSLEKCTDERTKDLCSPLNEPGIGALPKTPVDDRTRPRLFGRAVPNATPQRTPSLQQSLRGMQLDDCSRSPRARRCPKTIRSTRSRQSNACATSFGGGMDALCRPIFDEGSLVTPLSRPLLEEPQTNVNPFASTKESIRKKGLKRLREEYDWYVWILIQF